jgi:hypothetical protein
LDVAPEGAHLQAQTVTGAMRGLAERAKIPINEVLGRNAFDIDRILERLGL